MSFLSAPKVSTLWHKLSLLPELRNVELMMDRSLILRMAQSDLHSLPCPTSLFTVSFSLLIRLVSQHPISSFFSSPVLSGRSHFRSLDAADGFPPTEHSSHAAPKPAFTPFCTGEKWASSSFFSKTIKVVCRVIRSTAGAASGAGSFYFLWSLTVTVKIRPDSERTACFVNPAESSSLLCKWAKFGPSDSYWDLLLAWMV